MEQWDILKMSAACWDSESNHRAALFHLNNANVSSLLLVTPVFFNGSRR